MGCLSFVLLSCLLLFSCREPGGDASGNAFTVTGYNVQNLFDAADDGTEYEEYTSAGGWTDQMYEGRLEKLASVLRDMEESDVFVLEEVEGRKVVGDLARKYMAREGYLYWEAVKNSGDATGIGILSRERPSLVRAHRVPGGRPVLEADFRGGEIVVLGVHAKSRIGEGTEEKRIECVRMLESLREDHPASLVIAIGDFNEDPEAGRGAEEQTAFIEPENGNAGLWAQKGTLLVTGDRGKAAGSVWYCPWLDETEARETEGSCFFSGAWHRYDNALAAPGSGWDAASFGVHASGGLLGSDGRPLSWERKLLSGWSDHLPVTLSLRKSR